MSRRRAYTDPWPGVFDLDLLAILHGEQSRQDARPMPGCRQLGCCGRQDIGMRISRDRVERLVSGADLVPILARVLVYLHAVLIGVRLGGGGLW